MGPADGADRLGVLVVTHLLYLHGFRSSPHSFKAQMMAAWLAEHRPDITWWCPQLPPSPREAIALAEEGTLAWPRERAQGAGRTAVLGSSLGGFYATVLAERWGCNAVVMNPAVDPARDLVHYIGEQQAFHDPMQRFEFRAAYIDELRAMAPGPITRPERYFALIAKGDELLDWREMSARYPGAAGRLLEGGDHGLSDFALHLPAILDFLQLT
ncbi:MAG: esterase [Burkholderiales bacterium]|nr:esterase [Burkholderiales bacterium]